MQVGHQSLRDVLFPLLHHAPQSLQVLDPELQGASSARVEGDSGPLLILPTVPGERQHLGAG